jgi:hypothetical protein
MTVLSTLTSPIPIEGDWDALDLPLAPITFRDISQGEAGAFLNNHPRATNLTFVALRKLYYASTPQHIDSLWRSILPTALQQTKRLVTEELDGMSAMPGGSAFLIGANTVLTALEQIPPHTFARCFRRMNLDWGPHMPTAIPTVHTSQDPFCPDGDAAPGLIWEVSPEVWQTGMHLIAQALAAGAELTFDALGEATNPPTGDDVDDAWQAAIMWAETTSIHVVAAYSILAGLAMRLRHDDARLCYPSVPGKPWKAAEGGSRLVLSCVVQEGTGVFTLALNSTENDVLVVDAESLFSSGQLPEA